MSRFSRASDEQILMVGHLRENEGMTFNAIAERMGMSRNSVAGIMSRLRRDPGPSVCRKSENCDGGMPPLWWRAVG